jgi:hypothetical protein
LPAPSVGEGKGIRIGFAVAPKERRGVAGDAVAPIDDRAKHVEPQSLHTCEFHIPASLDFPALAEEKSDHVGI